MYPDIRMLPLQSKFKGHYKCGTCINCSQAAQIKVLNYQFNQHIFTLNRFTNINLADVIYALQCPCNLLYVGMTTHPLKYRLSEYHNKTRNHSMNAPLVSHFLILKHKPSDFAFFVTEKLHFKTFYIYDLENRVNRGRLFGFTH